MSEDLKKEFKKYGISAKKHGGDDAYSWAVFVKGRPQMEGLSQSEVPYYKRQILKMKKEEEARLKRLEDLP